MTLLDGRRGVKRSRRGVGAVKRVSPREDEAEILAADGTWLIGRHGGLSTATHPQRRADGLTDLVCVVPTEGIRVHREVLHGLPLGLLTGGRVAAKTVSLERRLGGVERRSLLGSGLGRGHMRMPFVGHGARGSEGEEQYDPENVRAQCEWVSPCWEKCPPNQSRV